MSPRSSTPINLEHVLLALLDHKPMHGYDLYHELCAMPGIKQVWNIKLGLLYAIMDKLETQGLVSSRVIAGETHPDRREFVVTHFGRQSLSAWMTAPVRRPRDLRQEFLAKLIVARRYDKEQVLQLIHAQQHTCLAWNNQLIASKPPLDDIHMDEWLVYSFRINRLEGILDWLKTCESELSREHPVP